MKTPEKILIATHNPGKILEYRVLCSESGVPIITLEDLGIKDEPEEDGKTFEENALKKSNFYSRFANIPVLAEDGGLEIDYLNGEPGVFSRRWLGRHSTDEELINYALQKLKGVPKKERGAAFKVVLALKFPEIADPILSEGELRGFITEEIMSPVIPGFPFRSIFYVPELGKVLGALEMSEEAKVAHRRMAFTNLLAKV